MSAHPQIFGQNFGPVFGQIFGQIFGEVFGRVLGKVFAEVLGEVSARFSLLFNEVFGKALAEPGRPNKGKKTLRQKISRSETFWRRTGLAEPVRGVWGGRSPPTKLFTDE